MASLRINNENDLLLELSKQYYNRSLNSIEATRNRIFQFLALTGLIFSIIYSSQNLTCTNSYGMICIIITIILLIINIFVIRKYCDIKIDDKINKKEVINRYKASAEKNDSMLIKSFRLFCASSFFLILGLILLLL